MPRATWKGAISFGLVHIPVALYPASKDDDIDFDWLDKRSMQPVGYKRINKATGREVAKDDIVRGVRHGDGRYVVLSDDEIKAAYPKATQTIDIEAFVAPEQIPFVQLERPYYLEPAARGEKVYALLREALLERRRVGIARIVMSRKQHLAVLAPAGPALVLNLLRWAAEIRPWADLDLPQEGRNAAGIKDKELQMAVQLIDDMTDDWKPEAYRDSFKDDIQALVERKAQAGEAEIVEPIEPDEVPAKASNVVDLTDLLKRSLKKPAAKAAPGTAKATATKAAPRTTRRKRA
jgi:DNA end-binding protein Ku